MFINLTHMSFLTSNGQSDSGKLFKASDVSAMRQ